MMRAALLIAILCGLQGIAIAGEVPPSKPEIVHFPSGSLTLGGELYRPTGAGPFPAVLYNLGRSDGGPCLAENSNFCPVESIRCSGSVLRRHRNDTWCSKISLLCGG